MGFKCGIVGLPNVGKSTLFNALCKANIAAANYPFCTIEPNQGVVPVPDVRLKQLADIIQPKRIVPTTIEFVDIAGLVAGAAEGEGLGNQFLAHIRETDAIAQVVRCFEDDNITHVAGQLDPCHDMNVINTELALADLGTIEKGLTKLNKTVRTGDKEALASKALLERLMQQLDAGHAIRQLTLNAQEQKIVKQFGLLTAKPLFYIANITEQTVTDNPYWQKAKALASEEHAPIISLCATLESEINSLDETDQKEFLEPLGLTDSGLTQVIQLGYKLLNLETFFTAGVKEVRAWTIQKNTPANDAAAVIHTDFSKGFIRAEVISFNDFIECGGETAAKEAGKLRVEGKDYLIQDGDVVHFRFNV